MFRLARAVAAAPSFMNSIYDSPSPRRCRRAVEEVRIEAGDGDRREAGARSGLELGAQEMAGAVEPVAGVRAVVEERHQELERTGLIEPARETVERCGRREGMCAELEQAPGQRLGGDERRL